MKLPSIQEKVHEVLQRGVVIPALPLALNKNRRLDERHQRALIRYYMDAGSGGIAAGVHTTQFAIRKAEFNLFQPVLELTMDEVRAYSSKTGKTIVKVAGVIGKTDQAIREAQLAADLGYDAVLLSLAAFSGASNDALLRHCRAVAEIIPLIGFYLQPAVGGRNLDLDFWRSFSSIENVVAIKIAPFNRYQTLDVVRGVVESGREDQIALYTGNDDNILVDLLTEYAIHVDRKVIRKRIVGGLLGHWAVWTQNAVQLLEKAHQANRADDYKTLLTLATFVTDANAAFFDAANHFKGVIAGIHEVLRRQGLLEGIWTLDPEESLSPGQKEEIDRVYHAYPELNDDTFVKANLERWLRE
jgi:dihydrodipicolinate synthase/N-acetylneuraminate lyase